MSKKSIKIAVTGPRPENMAGVPASYVRSNVRDTLDVYLEEYEDDVRVFCGMARGVDTIFATQALRMGIPLTAVIPFKGFDSLWPAYDRQVLADLLSRAKEVIVVASEASKGAYQARNELMVNKSDVLLAYQVPDQRGGTYNCVQYAKKVKSSIINRDITNLFPLLAQPKD